MELIRSILENLYQTLFVTYPALVVIILALTIALMGKIRLFAFKKLVIMEVATIILIAGLYYVYSKTGLIPDRAKNYFKYGVYVFGLIANIFVFINLLRSKLFYCSTNTTAVEYLKNANVDIYLEVKPNGKIKECNLEFLSVVNTERKDVIGKKLLPLILEKVDIVTFDGDVFNESTIQALTEKSKTKRKHKSNVQFEIQYRNSEGSLVTYHFFEIPIFIGNTYNGRLLVGEKEKSTLLVRAQTALGQLMADTNLAKQQTYALFTLLNEPSFFFDHATKKYLLSEKIRKVLNLTETEINFDHYLKLMHPDDIDRFVEKSAEVNSRTITKFTYRLRIGNEYMIFEESSIMLDDENCQASLIRLVKVRKEKASEVPTQEQEGGVGVQKAVVSEKPKTQLVPKPVVKATNDDLLKELKVLEDKIFTKK